MVVTKHQQTKIVQILEAERRQMSNNSAFIHFAIAQNRRKKILG